MFGAPAFPVRWAGQMHTFFLHLDEGTGLRKSGVLVISAQTIFGGETARNFEQLLRESPLKSREAAKSCMSAAQSHNARGSTYKTRYLYTAIPKRWYTKRNSRIYRGMLDLLAREAVNLFSDGLEVQGAKYYFVCLGLKADQLAQAKAGCFCRSFLNLGANKGCCFECLAGFSQFPFEDTRPRPAWLHTVGQVPPWSANASEQSPLLQIPFMLQQSEKFFRKDPFHIFKQSLGGHFVASTIILLMDLGYYTLPHAASNSVEEQLERTYFDFAFFAKHEFVGKTVPYIKHFTRLLLHFQRHSSFPFGRFKGSDTMLMIRWLQHLICHGPIFEGDLLRPEKNLIRSPLAQWHAEFFHMIAIWCSSSLKFFHILHTSGIWLMPIASGAMANASAAFSRAYSRLATLCFNRGLCRYHLEPSQHYFYHYNFELRSHDVIMSPATENCEADEDFIGRVCRLARCVHASTTTLRVLERHLIKCYFEFEEIKLSWMPGKKQF